MTPRLQPGRLGLGYALAGFVASIACALVIGMSMQGDLQKYAFVGQYVAFIVVALLIVRVVKWRSYRADDLGLNVPSDRMPWVLGAAGGLLFVAIGQIASRLMASIGESGKEVAAQVGFGESLTRDVLVAFTVAILGPIGEELIFRGLVFRGIFDGLSRWRVPQGLAFGVGAIVSAAIFSWSHGGGGQQQQFWFLLIFGLIAAGLYWWTGSLIVAAFAHVVCNAINVGLLLYATPPTTPLIWGIPLIAPVVGLGLMLGIRRLLGGLEPAPHPQPQSV